MNHGVSVREHIDEVDGGMQLFTGCKCHLETLRRKNMNCCCSEPDALPVSLETTCVITWACEQNDEVRLAMFLRA